MAAITPIRKISLDSESSKPIEHSKSHSGVYKNGFSPSFSFLRDKDAKPPKIPSAHIITEIMKALAEGPKDHKGIEVHAILQIVPKKVQNNIFKRILILSDDREKRFNPIWPRKHVADDLTLLINVLVKELPEYIELPPPKRSKEDELECIDSLLANIDQLDAEIEELIRLKTPEDTNSSQIEDVQ